MEPPTWCPECGSVLDPEALPVVQQLRAALAERDETIEALQREVTKKTVQVSRLTSEQNRDRHRDPHVEDAKEVYDYWRHKLSPRAREFNGTRLEKVLARLHAGYTVAELKQAVDGCAASPWYVNKGKTDLELICRDEAHVQQFQSVVAAPPALFDTRRADRVMQVAAMIARGQVKDLLELTLIGHDMGLEDSWRRDLVHESLRSTAERTLGAEA